MLRSKRDVTLIRYAGLMLIVVFLSVGCQNRPDWPQQVTASMWIDKGAQNLQRNILNGTLQIQYTASDCYPGNRFLQTMQYEMQKRGWERLDHDFLNPTIVANHRRMSGGLWSHILDGRGNHVYQWIDDWQDSNNNVIRYGLKYRSESKNVTPENICKLDVAIIYIPKSRRGVSH